MPASCRARPRASVQRVRDPCYLAKILAIISTPNELSAALEGHVSVLRAMVESCDATLTRLVEVLVEAFTLGNKLLLCGNGGSAADAQHVAGEFVNRLGMDRRALPALALTTDTSVLTCIANDSSFEEVFARQVEALARPRDVVVGISTSGRSANVLKALAAGRRAGAFTVGVTGASGARTMSATCDLCVAVPSDDTPRIQEAHLFAWHVVCSRVEEAIASTPGRQERPGTRKAQQP